MTENRANPDLSLQEEYERSGHTVKDLGTNAHAEGYVGSVPAVNAPGGLASAGYPNCHVVLSRSVLMQYLTRWNQSVT